MCKDDGDPLGPLRVRVVDKLHRHSPTALLNLHIGDLLVRSTANHPFWEQRQRRWTPAAKLQAGDLVLGHDGRLHEVTDVFDNGDVEPVFNLAVAECHTYFVASPEGGMSALVHNDYQTSLGGASLSGQFGFAPAAGLPANSWESGAYDSLFDPSGYLESGAANDSISYGAVSASASARPGILNPNQAARHVQTTSPAPNDPFQAPGMQTVSPGITQLTQTDAAGQTTTYSYNPAGQLTEEQDPNGQTVLYSYDSAGRLLTETDEDGANTTETEYSYDSAGHVLTETLVSGGQSETTSYAYDASGNLIQEIDPDGRVTTFAYNSQNELVGETWYASVAAQAAGVATDTFVYTYNAAGLLATASDDNSSYTFTYDAYGRILKIDNAGTPNSPRVVLTYAYAAGDDDPDAQPISVIATDGAGDVYYEDDYTYNSLGQETSVTQTAPGQAAETAEFLYGALGQIVELDRYEGTQLVATSTYAYDSSGNLLSIDNANAAGQTIDNFSWAYEPGLTAAGSADSSVLNQSGVSQDSAALAGIAAPATSSLPSSLISSFTSSVDGTASYSYDADGQLLGANYTGAQPNESYTYDEAGNRTSAAGQTITVGPFNQISSDGTYNYAYDADGNLIRQTTIATGAYVVYGYDNRDRLVSVENFTASGSPTQLVTYTYDVFNNLIDRTLVTYTGGVAGTPVSDAFAFDSPQSNGQMVLEFQTTGGAAPTAANLTDSFLWGPAVDQILADNRGGDPSTQGDVLWTIDDNQNTVRDVVNSAGQVLDHIAYSGFGQALSHTATNPAAVDPIFGYTGKFVDPATGLQWNVNRWYNPALGVWMTRDPAQADSNTCRYGAE